MPGGVGIVAGDTAEARIRSPEAPDVSQSVVLEAPRSGLAVLYWSPTALYVTFLSPRTQS